MSIRLSNPSSSSWTVRWELYPRRFDRFRWAPVHVSPKIRFND
jgi:hypothetical protein